MKHNEMNYNVTQCICNVMNYEIIIIIGVCRAIAWDAIVLGGNKHFPGGVHYPGAIFRVSIIRGYISVANYSAGQ